MVFDVVDLTFPDCEDFPSKNTKLIVFPFIPLHSPPPLCRPELGVCCGCDLTKAAGMRVPKTAVYEYDLLTPAKNKIWFPGQVLTMDSKPISEREEQTAESHLRFRVGRTDSLHVSTPLFRGMYVHNAMTITVTACRTAGIRDSDLACARFEEVALRVP